MQNRYSNRPAGFEPAKLPPFGQFLTCALFGPASFRENGTAIPKKVRRKWDYRVVGYPQPVTRCPFSSPPSPIKGTKKPSRPSPSGKAAGLFYFPVKKGTIKKSNNQFPQAPMFCERRISALFAFPGKNRKRGKDHAH